MERFRDSAGLALLIAAAVTGGACDRRNYQSDSVRRDSAGTTIVMLRGETRAPTIRPYRTTTLASNDPLFYPYRVTGAVRLADKRIAVGGLYGRVFFFDSLGKPSGSFSRAGRVWPDVDAFTGITQLGKDTIGVLYDDTEMKRHVLIITADGRLIRDYPIVEPENVSPVGPVDLVGYLGNGRLLMWSDDWLQLRDKINRPAPDTTTLTQTPAVLFSVDRNRHAPLVAGIFPGADRWSSNATGSHTEFGPAPFGGWTGFGAHAGRVIVLRNDEPGFRVYSPAGELLSIYRAHWRVRRLSPKDRKEHSYEWLASLRREARQIARSGYTFEAWPDDPFPRWLWKELRRRYKRSIPASTPFFRDAVVGSDGTVWFGRYESWSPQLRLYIGYDSTGIALARLELPSKDQILEIGRDYALTLKRVDGLPEAVRIHHFHIPSSR